MPFFAKKKDTQTRVLLYIFNVIEKCAGAKQTLLRRGDPPEIRTPDTLLKRQVLCLLS